MSQSFDVLFLQQTLVYLLLTLGYLSASSLVVWLLLTYTEDPQHPWLPANTRHHLVTATVRQRASQSQV